MKGCRRPLGGDGSVSNKDAANYPDLSKPVNCEAYHIDPHAMQALRLANLADKGCIGNILDETDSWYFQAYECVCATRSRLQIAKMREAKSGN